MRFSRYLSLPSAMTDYELLQNKSPLNKAALEWLREANESTEPHHLYLLSLAAWGLANGSEGDWPDKNQFALEEQVNLLFGWHPANALVWLVSDPNGPSTSEQEEDLLSELENARNPQEAAAYILNRIYGRQEGQNSSLRPAASESK
jgi:hypothetical protein